MKLGTDCYFQFHILTEHILPTNQVLDLIRIIGFTWIYIRWLRAESLRVLHQYSSKSIIYDHDNRSYIHSLQNLDLSILHTCNVSYDMISSVKINSMIFPHRIGLIFLFQTWAGTCQISATTFHQVLNWIHAFSTSGVEITNISIGNIKYISV